MNIDIQQLIALLQGALSHDSNVQRQAEVQLNTLSASAGFCSCLVEVVLNKSNERSSRWLAVLTLKNHITKHWRQRPSAQSLQQDEKQYLRPKLLSLLPEEDPQIALQTAVILAKVARVDFPRDWPSLFTDLLAAAASHANQELTSIRVYLALHHILKELSSKRLAADQRNFVEVAKVLFDHVWSQWAADTQALMAAAPTPQLTAEDARQLQLQFDRWTLLLKVVKRLLLFGYPADARTHQPNPAVAGRLPALQQAIEGFLQLGGRLQQAAPSSQLPDLASTGVVQLIKCQRQVQELHPWSYFSAGALLPMMEFCCGRLSSAVGQGGPWPAPAGTALLTECLVFLCTVVQCSAYRLKAVGGQSELSEDLKKGIKGALDTFWTPQRLTSLTSSLITSYFTLTAQELAEWEADPEGWHHWEDSTAWQHSLHLAAHTLFLSLLKAHQDTLAPVVVQLLNQTLSQCPPGAPPASLPGPHLPPLQTPLQALLKDSIYTALSLGVYELLDSLDYSPLLHQVLLPELADQTPQNKYPRRRAARVVGSWVIALKPQDRPLVYSALIGVMEGGDMAVRLAGIGALGQLVDDMGFDEAHFRPVVSSCLRCLAQVLLQSRELDTLTQAFNLVNLIIERVGQGVQPHVGDLLQLLPRVWQETEGHTLVRIQVLVSLQRLISVLGPDSPVALPLVGPLLQHCLDPSHPESVSLTEDALALWGCALRHAPGPQPGLLELYPHLSSIMGSSTEYIAQAVTITCSCLMLGGEAFLAAHGGRVAAALEGYLGNVNDKGHLLLLHLAEVMLLVAPAAAAQLLGTFIQRVMSTLLAEEQESTTVTAAALVLAGRVALQVGASFPQLLQSLAIAHSSQPDAVLEQLLCTWTDGFDSISTPHPRKTSALGLCALLALPSPAPLQSLEPILTCVTGVCFELEDGEAGGQEGGDVMGCEYDVVARTGVYELGTWATEEAEGETNRLKQVAAQDAVNRYKVGAFLRQCLDTAAGAHGPQAVQAALQRMHPSLGQQVKQVTGL